MAGVSAVAARTRCASQIFSNIVRGFAFAGFIAPTLAPGRAGRPVTSATSSVKLYLTMDPALIPALHDALVVAQTGSVRGGGGPPPKHPHPPPPRATRPPR